MKKVKKAFFTIAALIALTGMALTTGCEKKQGAPGGATGGSRRLHYRRQHGRYHKRQHKRDRRNYHNTRYRRHPWWRHAGRRCYRWNHGEV